MENDKGERMTTLIVTGSPTSPSRTARLATIVSERLSALGEDSSLLDVRSIPAEDLAYARFDAPSIKAAVERVEGARGLVIATPVYKASYTGLLKAFLDLLPQFGLRDKVVLPLAVGGTVAHVLSIDYALRPVLQSLDALHVVPGLFALDKQITAKEDGSVELDPDLSSKLDGVIGAYHLALKRAQLTP